MRTTTSSNQGSSKKAAGPRRRVRAKTRRQTEQPGFATFLATPPERVLQITCNVPTPSPNQWVFKTWRTYWAIKRKWLTRLHHAAIQYTGYGLFGPPITRCALEIERRGLKILDEDNLNGGLKPLIDGLVRLGFLADDTPDVIIQTNYHQTRVPTKAEQGTVITLRELDGRNSQQQSSPETA